MSMFSNNKSFKLPRQENPLRSNTPAQFGEVRRVDVKSFRVKIRCFSGEILDNVKIPSGYITKESYLSGGFSAIQVGQLVKVSFISGSSQNPVIDQVYPYFAREKDEKNLSTFIKKAESTGKDLETDIAIGHSSGYIVWFSDKRILVEYHNIPVLEFDFTKSTFTTGFAFLQGNPISGGIDPSSLIPVSNGLILESHLQAMKTYMEEFKSSLNALYAAIQGTIIVPTDGGAALKTAMSTAIQTSPLPDPVPPVSELLNKTKLKTDIEP